MAFVTSFDAYDAMVSEESKQVDGKKVNGCSDHKSSARPKRKGKQKKVPQRGLGVAQLERMRMEEQKKKEVRSSSSSLMVPVARGVTVPTSNTNYDIPVPSFNFRPVVPDSTVPPTWDFTPQVVSVESSEPMLGFGFPSFGDQPVLAGSSFAADLEPLPYQQGQEKVRTMVNVSSTNSCSSGVLQIEPPSNQICLGNNKAAWPQDGKMVGVKRPLPCSYENDIVSPPTAFQWSTTAAFQWSTNTLPQFPSYVNNCYKSASWQDLCNYDSGSTISREGRSPSSSGVMQLHESDNICCGESNEGLEGGFLSLRPPSFPTIPGLNGEYCYPSSQIQSPNSSPVSEMEPRKPIYYSFLPEYHDLNHCDMQSERRNHGLEDLDLTLKL